MSTPAPQPDDVEKIDDDQAAPQKMPLGTRIAYIISMLVILAVAVPAVIGLLHHKPYTPQVVDDNGTYIQNAGPSDADRGSGLTNLTPQLAWINAALGSMDQAAHPEIPAVIAAFNCAPNEKAQGETPCVTGWAAVDMWDGKIKDVRDSGPTRIVSNSSDGTGCLQLQTEVHGNDLPFVTFSRSEKIGGKWSDWAMFDQGSTYCSNATSRTQVMTLLTQDGATAFGPPAPYPFGGFRWSPLTTTNLLHSLSDS